MGKHTITGLLTTSGNLFADWSADYRLYQHKRVDVEDVFRSVFRFIAGRDNDTSTPLVTALDDSLLRKQGKKIPYVKYTRDPMGPPFSVNFVRGQRVIQLSAAVTDDGKSARMIPVIFRSAPSADKPKRSDSEKHWEMYKEQAKQQTLSKHGLACIEDIREQMNAMGQDQRPLWLTVDGSYTNRTVLRQLPQGVTLIGRIRGDAKLSYSPDLSQGLGRKRVYGDDAPTPEELRRDETIPWKEVSAYISGKEHRFRIKSLQNLRWRVAGKKHNLRLIVIAPLRYRLTKKSRLLYRKPGYLICTDPHADLQKVLQAYLWRWDIEVNFRDEKTLLGVGQAQVRNESSVKTVPQMMVAAYALLLTAATKAYGVQAQKRQTKRPKWRQKESKRRISTMSLIQELRKELWAEAISENCNTHFAYKQNDDTKSLKLKSSPFTAVFGVAA